MRCPTSGSCDSSSVSCPSSNLIRCLIAESRICFLSMGFFQLSGSYFFAPYSSTRTIGSRLGKWTRDHWGLPSLYRRALSDIMNDNRKYKQDSRHHIQEITERLSGRGEVNVFIDWLVPPPSKAMNCGNWMATIPSILHLCDLGRCQLCSSHKRKD